MILWQACQLACPALNRSKTRRNEAAASEIHGTQAGKGLVTVTHSHVITVITPLPPFYGTERIDCRSQAESTFRSWGSEHTTSQVRFQTREEGSGGGV